MDDGPPMREGEGAQLSGPIVEGAIEGWFRFVLLMRSRSNAARRMSSSHFSSSSLSRLKFKRFGKERTSCQEGVVRSSSLELRLLGGLPPLLMLLLFLSSWLGWLPMTVLRSEKNVSWKEGERCDLFEGVDSERKSGSS